MSSPLTIEPRVGCIAAAMRILGQKWTALIIRDLYIGSRRFGQLEESVGQITPRTLSQRLEALQNTGIVTRDGQNYVLTTKGRDLIPILEKMAAWGDKHQEDCR